MAKETWWFGRGSRIIITTQYQDLFRAHRISHIYKVDFPLTDEALQIFCMNAFGQSSPQDGFEELAQEVVRLAGKLPLGLRVLGSYFRRISRQEWANALPKLRTSINMEIGSILKFSYDALDEDEKDLFLHLTFFFNYEKINKVENHLANRFLDVRQGLKILAEKSLISLDHGYIEIHNLLIQLGKDIVRKQSIQPGQRQFLVDKRDICELLIDGAAGSRSVICIDFDFDGVKDELNISERAFEGMPNLQFIRFYGRGHNKLHLSRGLDYLSRNLRLLYWTRFPMTSLPSVVNSEFLVEVDLRSSKLEKLWEGIKPLQNLRWMYLSFSVNLKELPDLSTATNLQRLDLIDCSSLVKLPSTIGYTNNLQILNLRNCSSLISLPSFIGNATNLKELDLSGCSSLVELPSSMGNATNLQILKLHNCSSLISLPSFMGNATNLKKLELGSLSCVVELPSWIGNATNLVKLDLSHCLSLVELPASIGNLQKLQDLILKGCSKLEVLPININLESLHTLDLTDCSHLKFFPDISTNITDLNLRGTAIKEVPLSIRSWSRLKVLEMSYTENLKEFPHAFNSITALYLNDTEIQEIPPWFKRISRLRHLVLKGCRKLAVLSQLPDSLFYIEAEDCESLERLDCSFHHPRINLNFVKCFKLNQEARDLIIQTPTSRHAVLPGGKVPAYFTHRATNGDSLTVKLNERHRHTLMRFKACILLVHRGEDEAGDDVSWMARTGRLLVTCRKRKLFLYPSLTEHLYIFEVEAEVTSSELIFEFKVDHKDWMIGECGVCQLMDTPSC